MNEIFIIGAGGHAKEVYSIIERISLYNFCGFIHEKEDGLFKIGNKSFKVFNEKILNNLNKNTNLVIGISKNNLLVKKIINECSDHFNFPNIIDPLSYLNYNFLNIDKGNVVFMNTIISSDISIGSFNIFNYGCVISHDVKIGDFNIFSPSVKISGNVDILEILIILDQILLFYNP